MGYARAVKELATQVRSGQASEPEIIVAALGSGGTVAGLIEGLEEVGLRSKVLAVRVVPSPLVTRASTLALAWALARKRKTQTTLLRLSKRLLIDDEQLGRGYGYETSQGVDAGESAMAFGIRLDQTYTAKAFAGALSEVKKGQYASVLYWHTLSSRDAKSLLSKHGAKVEIPPELQRLFIR
jgi:D-cysteine desulfhydrase